MLHECRLSHLRPRQSVGPLSHNASMLARSRGQRGFLAEGRPWKDAVIAYLEPRSPYRPWLIPSAVAAGNLIITVLDTDPRTVLCVERMGPTRRGTVLEVVEESRLTLPSVSDIEAALSITLPTAPGRIDDGAADRLLEALSMYEERFGNPPRPFADPHRHDGQLSSARSARVLLESGGVCAACGDRVNLRGAAARERVHVHLPDAHAAADEQWSDRSAALCTQCHKAMSGEGFTSFVEYRFSLQPRCPRCQACRTQEVVYGMPPGPGWLDDKPWMAMGGCAIGPDSPRWGCGVCGYHWHYNVDRHFGDEDDPHAGDYVAAHLFNFDGRRPHTHPPDVEDPHEMQIGTLIIEDVDSAWGGYTRYAVLRDDGCLREIEPDTIVAVGRTGT
ncbi:hypothetical protein [Rhodococcus ruber]|uniref:hypothetical protein n=1 Tax=Rhodococcus ruber TaxID=1830 RepID=UPI000F547E7A|nr:hypothetical protein [Rhodococcus ruber]